MHKTPRTTPSALERLRRLCLSLPGTSEVAAWGHPNFRVAGKTFAVFEFYKSRPCIAVKSEIGLQQLLVDSEHFFRTPYLGDRGWISVWVDRPVGWRLIGDLVRRSYSLVGGRSHDAGQAGLRRSRRPIRRGIRGTRHD